MRIRIEFKKTEPMRFTSHLDLHRAWVRTIRRADLPITYSGGFHPQPKINLACALPLGITSDQELIDLLLDVQIEIATIKARLMDASPPGIVIVSVEEINNNSPTLQSIVTSTIYQVILIEEIEDLDSRINKIINTKEIYRERRGKIYDLRPLIERISSHRVEKNGRQVIIMQLTAREGATGRPDEVLGACSIDPSSAIIHRVKLLLMNP